MWAFVARYKLNKLFRLDPGTTRLLEINCTEYNVYVHPNLQRADFYHLPCSREMVVDLNNCSRQCCHPTMLQYLNIDSYVTMRFWDTGTAAFLFIVQTDLNK
uniref:Uncharacterized protein n=1 Tax=Pyxicephalus adspersus TaxID=30357 RepID=A0AAV3AU24_PYXAD|nr:TPA: hypothetical protein GDO54_010449 [Pyxicephalus adspersus]